MQRKIIIDTSVYIDIFNHNRHSELINPFLHVTYLAYPVLHELWMGLKKKREIRAMAQWRDRFIRLKRLVVPTAATLYKDVSFVGCIPCTTNGNGYDTRSWLPVQMIAYGGMFLVRKTHPSMLNFFR